MLESNPSARVNDLDGERTDIADNFSTVRFCFFYIQFGIMRKTPPRSGETILPFQSFSGIM